MDIEFRKISFVQEFLRLDNETVIENLEKLLRKSKADMYENAIQPIDTTQLNAEIDKALNDSENDRMIKAKDLRTKVQKWN